MNYLIIGSTSLFGRSMLQTIKNHDPSANIVLTKLPDEKPPFIGYMSYDMNLLDIESINSVFNEFRPDIIFDFAVQNSVYQAWQDPSETVDVNIIGTTYLLDCIRKLNYTPRVVIAGSGEEYGKKGFLDMPLTEEANPNPVTIFAVTKVCQTMLMQLYSQAYDMDLILLRTFNEIGVGQSDRFVVSNFCHQFAKMEINRQNKELIVGNTKIKRDFTDVRDLIEAFWLVSEKGKTGEIYNAGRGEAISIEDVINILEEETGIKVSRIADSSRVRPIDIPIFQSDNSKIYNDTGWKSTYPLNQTILDMLNYWREYEKTR